MNLTLRHLVWREVKHRRGSFTLTVLCVGVACATVVSVLAALERHRRDSEQVLLEREMHLREQLARYDESLRRSMQHLGFNILLLPAGQNLSDFYADDFATHTMPAGVLDQLAESKLMTIEHLVARLREKVLWPEKKWTIQVVGTDTAVTVPSEDAPELHVNAPPPGQVDLGYEVHRGFDLAAGNTIELRGKPFRVRRCLPEAGTVDDVTVWMTLADAQIVLEKAGKINEILALECRTAWKKLATVRNEIAQVLPGIQVIEKRSETLAKADARELMAQEGQAMLARERAHRASILSSERRLGGIVGGAVVALAALWVGIITILNVRGRRIEIGILRAGGAGRDIVAGLFAGRAAFAAMLGAAGGFLAALGLCGPRPGLAQSIGWFLVSLAVALTIALVSGVLPALRALTVDPAIVLKHDA